MKTKQQEFKEHPENFLLECCVCKKKFLPLSYKQYDNLVKKHKKYLRGFFCSDKCRRISRGSKSLKCDTCGNEIIVNNWEFKHNKRHYCSRDCWRKSPYFNKEKINVINKDFICLSCGKVFKGYRQTGNKFCSRKCSNEYKIKLNYSLIEKGEQVSHSVLKHYLLNKYKICMNPECKWDWSGNNNPALEMHHKDGNHNNNTLENCLLLCPNCHSLTDNYKNKGNHQSTRKYRTKYYKQ